MSTVTTRGPSNTGDRVQGVLSGIRCPPAASALSASLAMGWRALLKIKHVPFQLFDAPVLPLTSTLLFTYLFGGALAGSPREYIQFLLPGILMQSVVFVAVNPVSHLVTASRALMHGEAATGAVMWVLVASAAITAVFAPIAFRLYGRER